MAILRHDKLFRKALENPIAAKEFFDTHLPEEVKALVDTGKLVPEKESFVEENLKNSISDVLFKAKFAGEDGYLYLLVEHQSSPDLLMAFRLFKYMLNICSRHLDLNPDCKKLPLIYPLLFYNGKRNYNAARNIWDLFTKPELAKSFWINDYQLINVQEIPDEELKKKAWAGILQFFMKHIHARDLFKKWQEVKDLLPEITQIDIGYDYIAVILCYTLTNIDESKKQDLRKFIKDNLKEKEEEIMASIAEQWIKEGEQRGIQIGEQRGKAEGIQIGEQRGKTEGMQIGEQRGIQIGEHKAQLNIAQGLLAEDFDIYNVAKITGLPIEEVKKLQISKKQQN